MLALKCDAVKSRPQDSQIEAAPALKIAGGVEGGAADWIDVATAAAMKGITPQAIRAHHLDGWKAAGQTKEVRAEGGGKCRTMILAAAITGAAPEIAGQLPGSDLVRGLSGRERAEWQQRCYPYHRIHRAVRSGIRAGLTKRAALARILEELEAEGIELSARTYDRWDKLHREAKARGESGDEALIFARAKGGKDAGEGFGLYRACLKQLRLRPEPLPVSMLIRAVRCEGRKRGWGKPPSASTCYAWLEADISPVEAALQKGPECFQNTLEPCIKRTYGHLESGQIVCIDTHITDVLVKDGERVDSKTGEARPNLVRLRLVAAEDLASRRFWYVLSDKDPTAETYLLLFGKVFAECIPQVIYMDNGKAEGAKAITSETRWERRRRKREGRRVDPSQFRGVLATLEVEIITAWPYSGKSKPVEKLFGTICTQFSKLWPTYVGRNPAEKPEQLEANIKGQKYPTREEFEARFADYHAAYHNQPHHGDGMDGLTPNQAWERKLVTKRTAPAELLEVLLQPTVGPLRVGQFGVVHHQVHYGQGALAHLLGQQVFIRVDDADVSKVSVWSAEGRFLALAESNLRCPMGATDEVLREAIATKKRLVKAVKAGAEARLRIHMDIPDLMIEALAEDGRARAARNLPPSPAAPPVKLLPVRSDLEGQMEPLQRARKYAKTAAAEPVRQFSLEELTECFARKESEPEGPRVPSLLELMADDEPWEGRFRYKTPPDLQAERDAEDRSLDEARASKYESPKAEDAA